MAENPEFTNISLTVAAAQVLLHWLSAVPVDVIPVTHPADRQALADLLTALEWAVVPPDEMALARARELLTQTPADWRDRGPTYHADADG